MKKTKKIVAAVALTLTVLMCAAFALACGGYSLADGSYTGTYTCHYTSGDTSHWGYTAEFEVQDNYIWNVALSAPAADWDGASADETYATAALGQRPWDSGKILGQFSGAWTVDEIMNIRITVNASGYPEGADCIESDRDLTVGVGFETGTALAILAMQNAIETASAK